MKPALALAFALALLAPAAAPEPAPGARVVDLVVDVGGQPARGLLGVPAGEPEALVLVLHGYGHQAESHRGHLLALAQRGALAAAMDYRGPADGFPLRAGADDSCAAFRALHAGREALPAYLYSVSMGTAVASMVLVECPLFDLWVVNEGLSMLHETWAGAAALSATGNAFAVRAREAIEQECGGTPAHAPSCYLERSAATRGGEVERACGEPSAQPCRALRGAYLAHGVHDGLVPYDQGREMVAALRAAGVPADFWTVLRGEPGGEGTTVTGHAGFQVDGLAGHGTESNDTHTLTALSFGLLYDLVEGRLAPPADREMLVDRGFGTVP